MVALTRRAFLVSGTSLAGGLCLALRLPLAGAAGKAAEAGFAPNAFVQVAGDGVVTLTLHKSEMGQGTHSGLAAILADELDVDLATVRLTMADEDPAYYLSGGMMGTGGSTSIRLSWDALADAAASARAMLVAAAARTWQVEPAACRTAVGKVLGPTGQALGYGELAALVATLPVPEKAPRKPPAEYRYIGKPTPRVDNLQKITGQARFGIDVTLPGLLTAVVLRPAQFGGALESFDATAAQALPGVRKIVAIDSGVGVIADGYWQARRAAQKIIVKWRPAAQAMDSMDIAKALDAALEQPGSPARRDGDVEAALKAGGQTLEATYRLPFLAHACLEPMNATAHVRDGHCEIWAPTQGQTRARDAAAKLLGIPRERVTVHTTYLGGGFGRRFEVDFVLDAVALSRAAAAPVKVIWSREDDLAHDFYRPAAVHRLVAALDQQTPTAWQHRIASPSIQARLAPDTPKGGIDRSVVEGVRELPYAIPNVAVDCALVETGVPVGYWRSVGNSGNAFVVESFIDELAHAAGEDPLAFRRRLLAEQPRHLRVLELAAERAGWGQPLPKGRARGLAVHRSFGSYVAQVAEVEVVDGTPQVRRVVCAIDCGRHVNPDQVVAQMEGGIVDALSAALYGEVPIAGGSARLGNFDTYPLLRLDRMPRIEVHIVGSEEPPGGTGEPGVPPLAPAVANALFALTGQRLRSLPLRLPT
ncbi:xanthine dehydrogenase family protein molybdopterin-binding subunit [Immundisolibacter sp.]|uniref:xanthine dehydrogenase family protein molybdopterin-binding subunit n=1 Tax=Immundisolibacter sp. TaxID=1934948 RepID=UPI002B13EF82|nr:molybdopterin cofactor-binding domain-containing protein [Immundisolibacter sp.]MEA3220332.1 Isoquinoline 1-oxidoreductase subunit beta [Immundisolibacter sp.]